MPATEKALMSELYSLVWASSQPNLAAITLAVWLFPEKQKPTWIPPRPRARVNRFRNSRLGFGGGDGDCLDSMFCVFFDNDKEK